MASVRLRRITPDDFDWLIEMTIDRDAVGEHNWAGPVDPTALRARLEVDHAKDGFVDISGGRLAIESDGEAVGDVSWRTEQWGPSDGSRCPAIGIAILPAHRGRGLGTDAQRQLVQFLFDTFDVHRVQSDTAIDNIAEQKALERAGFVREGVVRDAEHRGDTYHDHILYSVLRREWKDVS